MQKYALIDMGKEKSSRAAACSGYVLLSVDSREN
jgi:hypothetical protein